MAVRGHPGSISGFHRWIGARYRYLIHLPRKPLDNFKMSLVSTEHSRKLPQNISSEFIYGWILKTHTHPPRKKSKGGTRVSLGDRENRYKPT